MTESRAKYMLVVLLVTLLMVAAALPAGAGYIKVYQFTNTTGVAQSSVRAVTNGLESINLVHSWPDTWLPATLGYTVTGGVFCTTLTYAGPPLAHGSGMAVAWGTADNSCRLRDLRWGGGQVILPTWLGGMPGGGMVFYDWPDPGDLTVVITNDLVDPDNPEPLIYLSDIQFAISGIPLTAEDLVALGLGVGFVELRVASIDEDIEVLLGEIAAHADDLPSPSVNSLCKKMERAAYYKHLGMDEYLAGDDDGALFLWEKAAGHVQNFISEVTASLQKGNLSLELYQRWVSGIPGGPTTAPEIRDALLALPGGQALGSLVPVPLDRLEELGLDLSSYVPPDVVALYPGQFTAFVMPHMDLGAGFIMGGSVLDEDDNVVLEWWEQSVAEPAELDTEPPVITSASVSPAYLWPPDHSEVQIALDVVVSDWQKDENGDWVLVPVDPGPEATATWYVAGVASNQDEDGTGDGDSSPDWWVGPEDPQSLWLRAERSGNDPEAVRRYTITLMAIDMAGNLSEPCTLVIRVDHDMG